jgi:hypothetical protein
MDDMYTPFETIQLDIKEIKTSLLSFTSSPPQQQGGSVVDFRSLWVTLTPARARYLSSYHLTNLLCSFLEVLPFYS